MDSKKNPHDPGFNYDHNNGANKNADNKTFSEQRNPKTKQYQKLVDDSLLKGPGIGDEREVITRGDAGVTEGTFGEAEG